MSVCVILSVCIWACEFFRDLGKLRETLMKVRETRSISFHIVFRLRETRFRKDKPYFPLAVNSIKSRCPSFPQRRTRTFLDNPSFPQRTTRTFLDTPSFPQRRTRTFLDNSSFPQRRTRSAGNSRRGTRCGELDIYPSRPSANVRLSLDNRLITKSHVPRLFFQVLISI